MDYTFSGKKITGILSVIPSREITFEEEMQNYNFSLAKSMKLKMAMGYGRHRIAEKGQCSSDFCIHGLRYLFDNNLLDKDSIDAMLFVSQSPDYFMPPTSNVIQGHFKMKQDMLCLDINQGCAGFEIGLIESFMLLNLSSIKKVVLLNADVLSSKVSKRDRNSNPLSGDAAAITIVENDSSDKESGIWTSVKMDGTGAFALMIPAGGFRLPSSPETAVMEEDKAGNFRSKNDLVMQGDDVFNFVQREVPQMIDHILKIAGLSKDSVDYYMFHQPNKFMLNKLADAIGVQREKMPSNIVENFGNSSGVTVPLNIAYNLGDTLVEESKLLCLAGFGVGLTWSSILMRIGKMDFNKVITF